jgi:hypothetical protein
MAQVTLKDIILDAYAQALLAARQKGLSGDAAKSAARSAAARVVAKATGKAVTPEIVAKALSHD